MGLIGAFLRHLVSERASERASKYRPSFGQVLARRGARFTTDAAKSSDCHGGPWPGTTAWYRETHPLRAFAVDPGGM